MADWFIATEGVKVERDSASLASQIITAIGEGGVDALLHRKERRMQNWPVNACILRRN